MLDYEALIAKRREEATDKRIAARAYAIVELLSVVASRNLGRYGLDSSEESGKYEGKGFLIEFYHLFETSSCGGGGGRSYTRIFYRDAMVFSFENGKITSYVPGEWEAVFDELTEEADAAHARREEEHAAIVRKLREEAEAKLRVDLKTKWGIEI